MSIGSSFTSNLEKQSFKPREQVKSLKLEYETPEPGFYSTSFARKINKLTKQTTAWNKRLFKKP